MNSNLGASVWKKMLNFYEFFIQGVFLKLSKKIYCYNDIFIWIKKKT